MELQAFGAGQAGRIKIGAGEFFGATFVPRAIAALRERYPQLGFELHSGLTEVNYPRLLAGELDLHFGTLPQVEQLPDFLTATPLLKVRSRVIAGAQHPLVRKKKACTPADLARYPWAVLHHDREVIKRLFAVLDQAGDGKVGVSVELTSLAAMVQLLQAGPYLACFAEGPADAAAATRPGDPGLPEADLAAPGRRRDAPLAGALRAGAGSWWSMCRGRRRRWRGGRRDRPFRLERDANDRSRPGAGTWSAKSDGRSRLEAAGHLPAVLERKSHRDRMPVSGRSCGPAIDRGCVRTAR